jgi:hypothetical protein
VTHLTADSVANIVRKYLAGHQPGGVNLEVVEQGIRHEDGWWRVPVRPSTWPKKRYEYYEALAEIESELQEKEKLNVLIATSEPVETASDDVSRVIAA